MAALALGCGGESEPAAGGAVPAAPAAKAPAASTPEQLALTLQEMYEWDPAGGAARDLKADSAECQSQLTAQGLPAVAQHIQCMQRKGWRTRPPAS